MQKRILGGFRNFYVASATGFLVWMLFFDTNDLITQIRQRHKLSQLESEKEYYSEKIEEVREDRRELLSNPKLLEKFAREKYLMKKPGEEVFVLVPTESEAGKSKE